MHKRCKEHQSGARDKAKNKPNEAKLAIGITNGNCYAIYFRHSDSGPVLGLPAVSFCETEESALIAYYSPPWNSEKKKTIDLTAQQHKDRLFVNIETE